ncbi:MAG: SpoIIE family protein phosphatase [Deltaproteobacteria bacterium]|nr:SpoIIE family protein phosphatase [Deltaproteobacteria bacterium]
MELTKMPEADYFLVKRALNNDTFCGDTGIIKEFDSKIFIGIIDVLGHGEGTHEIALTCEDFLGKNYRQDLVKTMEGLHRHIRGSRGAVAGLCLLDLKTGDLKYVGMGDITARKFGSSNITIISRAGVVGYVMPTPREERLKLYDGDVLVLYIDGVKKHFDMEDYPELISDNARTIATRIIERFGKEADDALCIALRYRI